MVRQTNNHMFRCSKCLTIISDEGEIVCKENGIVVLNNASNIMLLPTMEVKTGVKIRPAICAECQHLVGYRLEQNLLYPTHQHKIVLQRRLLSILKDEDKFS